ncbi:MAG: iron ABC transporter permease [Candidatus Neomarinimicrobiota bacterium]|nr:iron ABC transporter permease [Candidatus Neomarinimicrobiota bacterium]
MDNSILKSFKLFGFLRKEFLFKLNLWTIPSFFIGLFIFIPMAEILLSLASPSTNWSHLKETVLFSYFSNSLVLVIGTAFLSFIFGVSSAWIISNYNFRFRRTLEWVLVLPLAIPTYISAYAYFDILELFNPFLIWVRTNINFEIMQLVNNSLVYLVTILVMASVLYPYIYLLARSSFVKQGKQLRDAALTLGYNDKSIFWKIALPMSRPAIVAGMSLVIMETLNDYGAVNYFGISTFTAGIFRTWLGMGDLTGALRLSAVLMLLIFSILIFERQLRSRSKYHEVLHSKPSSKKTLLSKDKSIIAIVCCLIPLMLGFIIPVSRLISWAWISRKSVSDYVSIELIVNSLGLATISSVSIVLIGIFLVFSARYYKSAIINFSNRLAILGYSIPGAVIAIGILLFVAQVNNFTNYLLTGSLYLLLFAYIVRYLAVAWQPINAGIESNCDSLNHASQNLGSSALTSLTSVNLPLIKHTMLTAGLLVFIDIVKELPLTLILRPFNFETLSTATFDLSNQAQIVESSIPALSMIIIVLAPLVFLNYRLENTK